MASELDEESLARKVVQTKVKAQEGKKLKIIVGVVVTFVNDDGVALEIVEAGFVHHGEDADLVRVENAAEEVLEPVERHLDEVARLLDGGKDYWLDQDPAVLSTAGDELPAAGGDHAESLHEDLEVVDDIIPPVGKVLPIVLLVELVEVLPHFLGVLLDLGGELLAEAG
uniref:Uncharacterized protein n=1 Tax=Strombidium rassoulzadegani TaxID=1082188 RepID=A0A7S3FT20_9SPIT